MAKQMTQYGEVFPALKIKKLDWKQL